ncbi:FecR domain-containing protein [Chitinophaga sp. 22321]|uniref:FecR family protein n=1 Tax=Chitinophaga hostae TaxID=2831022 RepID=A0ABS5IXI3_9BACT|nr:FecR family protein [Chitinophaga hostae]MBS0027580.1 FecR family protein [Chitinophaga hostae]
MLSARIKYLVERYFDNSATAAEKLELAQWIDGEASQEELESALGASWEAHVPQIQMPDEMSDRMVASFFGTVPIAQTAPVARVVRYRWWAAAAVLLLGGGIWWAMQHRPPQPVMVAGRAERYKNEVAPGGNRALLTLADGRVIELDSAGNGVLTQQGNVKIVKQSNGELAYEGNGTGEAMYNKMSTPRGGQYRLKLPDGTVVWLNAASSVFYPAAFVGKERRVTVTGEVYFEVAANANMPFIVKAGEVDITVMGTRFNVNAYEQEAVIKTTLVDGAVSVASTSTKYILKPGQQAQVKPNGSLAVMSNIDTEEIIAWKNGFFQFNDADMPTVMRQLEQWYDVKVSYEGDIPKRSFGGGIQRSLPLTEVLSILEANDVKFKINGKNITVLK